MHIMHIMLISISIILISWYHDITDMVRKHMTRGTYGMLISQPWLLFFFRNFGQWTYSTWSFIIWISFEENWRFSLLFVFYYYASTYTNIGLKPVTLFLPWRYEKKSNNSLKKTHRVITSKNWHRDSLRGIF